jgi:hypothetical protein
LTSQATSSLTTMDKAGERELSYLERCGQLPLFPPLAPTCHLRACHMPNLSLNLQVWCRTVTKSHTALEPTWLLRSAQAHPIQPTSYSQSDLRSHRSLPTQGCRVCQDSHCQLECGCSCGGGRARCACIGRSWTARESVPRHRRPGRDCWELAPTLCLHCCA